MKLVERDLEFDFLGALNAVRFDDRTTHATSSIQAVDFIVEYADCYRFIEVKDPDGPGAANVGAFVNKLRSGQLVRSLAGKYRDSTFFRGLEGKDAKKVEYIVLLAMASLDNALLLAKQVELRRSIPLRHHQWLQDSAATCVVLNLRQWKRLYGEASVRQLSEAALDGAAGSTSTAEA